MICKNCGKEFKPNTRNQIYCSDKCGQLYRYKNRESIGSPSITFTCLNCGKSVTTADGYQDRRTKFCSKQCRIEYDRKRLRKSTKPTEPRNTPSGQPCWSCRKATGFCSWSHSLKPIKGWKATPTTKGGNNIHDYMSSYKIRYCPEYEHD